jgi:hypothetical protein
MDFSLIQHYPHLVVCFFLSLFIGITQPYYARKKYGNKNVRKYYKQHRVVNIITIAIFFIMVISGFISCQNDDTEDEATAVSRTVIVYMAADNDLSADAWVDLAEMRRGFSETGAKLVVFIDPLDETPVLLEIGQGTETTVKAYPELNACDPAVMKAVLEEAVALYPAKEYGLILWSHATSWMPSGSLLRSFGEDADSKMNIPELASSLPVKFRFVLFDACLMGSVEVAYELKDKTDYLVVSSTETISDGFPYEEIAPELIKPQVDLKAVAQRYFGYYNAQAGADRSATISVIETVHLPELARWLKLLCEGNVADMQAFDRSAVQRLDVYDEQYTFDLLDFVSKVLPEADKTDFALQLEKAVLYKEHTPQFIQKYDINTYCGLSCYIHPPQRSDLNRYYKTLGWYAAAGMQPLIEGMEAASAVGEGGDSSLRSE